MQAAGTRLKAHGSVYMHSFPPFYPITIKNFLDIFPLKLQTMMRAEVAEYTLSGGCSAAAWREEQPLDGAFSGLSWTFGNAIAAS